MRSLFSDTWQEIEQLQIALARQMPAWRKLALVSAMVQTCRELALGGLRRRYPDAPPAELHRRLAAVLLDRETVRRVYGWDPLPPSWTR